MRRLWARLRSWFGDQTFKLASWLVGDRPFAKNIDVGIGHEIGVLARVRYPGGAYFHTVRVVGFNTAFRIEQSPAPPLDKHPPNQ